MNTGKYVFSQILELVNKYEFEKIEKKYNGNPLVQLNYLCFNIVYWSFKNKFIDELNQS
jgi:hypothetical protein